MEKIKFKRYDIQWKNHTYCILIPLHLEKLLVYDFDGTEGTGWIGDRKTIETMMYAAAILGFNPTDKIIYCPIRGNKKPEFYSYTNNCDLVLTTHQVQLKRSDWKAIKNIIGYAKEKTYILNYDEARAEKYFRKSVDKWDRTYTQLKKEYLIETMESHTIFQVFSRMQFQQIYLDLKNFLSPDLEEEFMYQMKHNCVPFTYLGNVYNIFRYKGKKKAIFMPFVDFYDEKLERKVKETVREKK